MSRSTHTRLTSALALPGRVWGRSSIYTFSTMLSIAACSSCTTAWRTSADTISAMSCCQQLSWFCASRLAFGATSACSPSTFKSSCFLASSAASVKHSKSPLPRYPPFARSFTSSIQPDSRKWSCKAVVMLHVNGLNGRTLAPLYVPVPLAVLQQTFLDLGLHLIIRLRLQPLLRGHPKRRCQVVG